MEAVDDEAAFGALEDDWLEPSTALKAALSRRGMGSDAPNRPTPRFVRHLNQGEMFSCLRTPDELARSLSNL